MGNHHPGNLGDDGNNDAVSELLVSLGVGHGNVAPALRNARSRRDALRNRLTPLPMLLASLMNGQHLPQIYGAPLRLRVENQLGYKMVKWIERIEFVESEKMLGKGEGGKNEDDEYFDLLPNI